MAKLSTRQIEKLIYPVSFYRYKARYIKATCAKLLEDFGGRTPGTMEELLTLPGVGRKTANLVVILAYESRRNICVDMSSSSTRTGKSSRGLLIASLPPGIAGPTPVRAEC